MMLSRFKSKIKNLVWRGQPTSSWEIPNPRDSDIYLVSYPKSGNTWIRYLMAYAIWPELTNVDLVEMAAYIPSFRLKHDSEMLLDNNAPCNQLKHRLIKEHTQYNTLAKKHVKRAICIVRDGRDVMVSYWHFCNQRDQTAIPLSDFIELSSKPGHSYGPWKSHVMGWLNADLDSKLIIRYEDLISDTASSLKNAMDFSGNSVPDSIIENAVKRASFDSMKKLEQSKGFNLEQLRTVEFIRQGKQGTWQESFGPGDLERFNKHHGGAIHELGYSW